VKRKLDAAPLPPHPGAALRPDYIEAEDAADNVAVFEYVVVVVAPLAR
jgi:hypothetical protein